MKTFEISDAGKSDRPGVVNMLEVIDGLDFPVTKAELVDYAQDQGASEEVLDLLQGMPERDYASLPEVNKYLGLIDKLPGNENLWASEESHDLQDPDPVPKPGSSSKL